MPNYVYQKLEIRDWNDTNKLKELKSKIFNQENVFDFNVIIPQPENIFKGALGEEERKQCIAENRPNWYDWNKKHWGTKWGAGSFELIKDEDDCLCFKFDTAWSIPSPILDKIIKIFKEFHVEYVGVDEGGFFAIHIIKSEGIEEPIVKEIKEASDAIIFALNN